MILRRASRTGLLYVIAGAWLVFTVSLASWWLAVGLQQASLGADTARAGELRRMFVSEGIVFIGLLVAGGVALLIAIFLERRRQRDVEHFFMTFTHDLKTSLASLLLQAESLREDLTSAAGNPNLDRLTKDARRLQLQLENSLYIAQPDGRLLMERVPLQRELARMADHFPEIAFDIDGDGAALVDTRAFESVLSNVIQNAVVHGEAARMRVRVSRGSGRVRVELADDGRGAAAAVLERLQKTSSSAVPTLGSGVGLVVSRELVARMNGAMSFAANAPQGMTVSIVLPEAS